MRFIGNVFLNGWILRRRTIPLVCARISSLRGSCPYLPLSFRSDVSNWMGIQMISIHSNCLSSSRCLPFLSCVVFRVVDLSPVFTLALRVRSRFAALVSLSCAASQVSRPTSLARKWECFFTFDISCEWSGYLVTGFTIHVAYSDLGLNCGEKWSFRTVA
jgi:hypothetical protein